jgi:hypothetical protein
VERVMWFDREPKEKLGKTLWGGLKESGFLRFKRLKKLYGLKNL